MGGHNGITALALLHSDTGLSQHLLHIRHCFIHRTKLISFTLSNRISYKYIVDFGGTPSSETSYFMLLDPSMQKKPCKIVGQSNIGQPEIVLVKETRLPQLAVR